MTLFDTEEPQRPPHEPITEQLYRWIEAASRSTGGATAEEQGWFFDNCTPAQLRAARFELLAAKRVVVDGSRDDQPLWRTA